MYAADEERTGMQKQERNLESHVVTLIEKLEGMLHEGSAGNSGGGAELESARTEVRRGALWAAASAECAAAFVYAVTVGGAAGGAGVGASAAAVVLASALAAGCTVAALTLCFERVSGAHVSPAVTAATCLRRRVSPLRAALYVAAQCAGAVAGTALLYGICGAGGLRVNAAASDTGAVWQRLAAEAVLSALVVGTHCSAAAHRWTGATPLLHAAAYIAATLVAMPYLNPARALGVAFVLGHWERHWVHWLGPLAGAVPVALLLEWTTRRPHRVPPVDDENYDDLDKGGYPPTGAALRHASSYCAAPAPTPNGSEPLYGGTRSLYCRSPQPARHALHRSQSVYSKSSCPGGPLVPARQLVVRAGHALAHSQNTHNAHREPAYGTTENRPGPTGAAGPGPGPGPAASDRRDSLYGSEGGRRATHTHSDDSAYGTYSRAAPYRPHHHTLADQY